MALIDTAYKVLCEQVLRNGYVKPSRVGETLSLPGLSIKTWKVDQEFPVLSSRKIFLPGILGELAAFLHGATKLREFKEQGCNYWDHNAAQWHLNVGREEPLVGKVYGHLWRNWPQVTTRYQPVPKLRKDLSATYLGIANGTGASTHPLLKTWQGMITRCYNPASSNYKYYGSRGVYVEDRWLAFVDFAADAIQLPGWTEKLQSDSSHEYELDKDTLGDGFCYSRQTCAWVLGAENNPWQASRQFTVQDKAGQVFTFTNPRQFCLEHGIEGKNFCDLWTGRKNAKTRYGYTLLDVEDLPQKPRTLDQVKLLIESISTDPFGRRHVLTTWHPDLLTQGALPPCHLLAQFYVHDDTLDCIVYMRSVDLALGLPSDLVLYGALLMLVAKETGMKAGSLHMQFGDAHIYKPHIEKLAAQLQRFPPALGPAAALMPSAALDNFTAEMFHLYDYQPLEAIKYELL